MPEQVRKLLVSGRGKLYRDKNPQGALDDFQKTLAKAPKQYEMEYEIGMVYLTLGQTKMAEDSFLKVIGASKDSFGDAQIVRGTLLVDKGEWEEGGKRLQRGMQLNPSSWMGHYQSARLETIQGSLVEAEADGKQARSLAPNAAINYRQLSIIHLREKKYRALLQDIDQYLELDPDSPAVQRARSVRGQVLEQIQKEDASKISPNPSKQPE